MIFGSPTTPSKAAEGSRTPGRWRVRRSVLNTFSLLALLLALFFQFTPTFASTPDLPGQISDAPILYQRLMWIGSEAPAESQNQELWVVVAAIQEHGVEPNLPEVEAFIAAHPTRHGSPH